MPTYEIEQYELHVMKYRLEADDEAHAIASLFDGKAEPVDGSLEYIETAEDFGLPVDEFQDLVDQLRDLDVSVGDDVIPSIRTIREVGAGRG